MGKWLWHHHPITILIFIPLSHQNPWIKTDDCSEHSTSNSWPSLKISLNVQHAAWTVLFVPRQQINCLCIPLWWSIRDYNGPLVRYIKLRVAHAPGMPGAFSPPSASTTTARAVMHVEIANPRWWGKRSRHSWRMRNPQFYLSGKRPIVRWWFGYMKYPCIDLKMG